MDATVRPALTNDIAGTYSRYMEEIGERLSSIRLFISESRKPENEYTGYIWLESCYLQIRHVCEITALASLLVHQILPQLRTSKLVTEYSASKIFSVLARENTAAFPRPIAPQTKSIINESFDVQEVEGDYITVDGLKRIYHSCDEKLHAGRLKPLLKKGVKRLDGAEIEQWVTSLNALLENHVIRLPSGRTVIVTRMNDIYSGGVCSTLMGRAS